MIESLYKPFQKWSEKGAIWIFSDPISMMKTS